MLPLEVKRNMAAIIEKDLPIGVFDSGFGGITVLAQLVNSLPNERFIYYADSAHAPYGAKSAEQIKQYSLEVVGNLMSHGIKALMVACNTATSVAINTLRTNLHMPVVGMEPALKPAIQVPGNGAVVVMATPVTLSESKFQALMGKFVGQKEIISLPCPGLVEIIEAGYTEGPYIANYLEDLYQCIDLNHVNAIVLGCTHYIYIRKELQTLVGERIRIIDGNLGASNRLRVLLQETNIAQDTPPVPIVERVQFLTSGSEELIPQCWKMLHKALDAQNK